MALHTVAYYKSIAEDTLLALDAVQDDVLALSSTSGIFVPEGMKVVAAYAGSASIVRARLRAQSLLRVGYPYIRPVQQQAGGLPPSDPNLQMMVTNGVTLAGNEVLSIDAEQNSGVGAETVYALVWLTDGLRAPPEGDAFWVRYTSSTTVTADAWTNITLTMDQLPRGDYAVVGFEHWSANCMAARLVFPGQAYRPGTLGQNGTAIASSRTAEFFYDEGLGVFGKFDAFAPPGVEVFATGGDGSHEGYLRLLKV